MVRIANFSADLIALPIIDLDLENSNMMPARIFDPIGGWKPTTENVISTRISRGSARVCATLPQPLCLLTAYQLVAGLKSGGTTSLIFWILVGSRREAQQERPGTVCSKRRPARELLATRCKVPSHQCLILSLCFLSSSRCRWSVAQTVAVIAFTQGICAIREGSQDTGLKQSGSPDQAHEFPDAEVEA